jgi:hypothetical protein
LAREEQGLTRRYSLADRIANMEDGRVETVEAGPLRAGSSNMSRAPLVVLLVAKADEPIAEVFEELAVQGLREI